MGKKEAGVGIIRIPSDGLATQEDGWVEMSAYAKTKHLPYFQGLDLERLSEAIALKISFEADDWDTLVERKEKAIAVVCKLLSVFVTDWNWKDGQGNPYPKPHRNAGALEETQPEEFEWLFEQFGNLVSGESVVIPKSNDTPS